MPILPLIPSTINLFEVITLLLKSNVNLLLELHIIHSELLPFSKFIDTDLLTPSLYKLFLIFILELLPYNVNNCSGVVVPIPRLPELVIRILSEVELVINW